MQTAWPGTGNIEHQSYLLDSGAAISVERVSIAVVVQGLFEQSDSVGYDAVLQYSLLRDIYGADSVTIFAENYAAAIYPEIPINDYLSLRSWIANTPHGLLIYHFCDGWPEFEEIFVAFGGGKIVRWHNNTPPWFYAGNNHNLVKRTVRGYRNIVGLLQHRDIRCWVNSAFSGEQLNILLRRNMSADIVWPGSRILLDAPRVPGEQPSTSDYDDINILFVSRIVCHKGHQHIISLLDLFQRRIRRKIVVHFPGRRDPSLAAFNKSLDEFALNSDIIVRFPGEVTDQQLGTSNNPHVDAVMIRFLLFALPTHRT